ncbi:LOW QUALITY PROTEIN: ankyrin repeat protein [Colletotrichum tofieldiae]|nr:LOW QUALITY PROTEIN: ankyrin repeat protein [Colletotrichum tofieldiae]
MNPSGYRQPQTYYDAVEPYLKHGDRSGNRQYLAHLLQTWSPQIDPDTDIGWAVHWAIFKGDETAVRMMMDAGVSPTVRDTQDPGFTPLLAASQYGRLEIARLLWEVVGPEGRFLPSKRNRTGPSCLLVAARNGHADLTAYFLDVWDGWDDEEKRRALRDAAWAWCDDTVAVLLDDSRVSYEPDVIQDALERAVGNRMILPEHETKPCPTAEDTVRHQRLVHRLIDAGANPDGEDRHSRWPLIHIASLSRGRIGALRGLLEKGADPNRQDRHGKTALHRLFGPLSSGRPDILTLQALLRHGALPELADEAGETPLHAIAERGSYEQLQLCFPHCRASDSETTELPRGVVAALRSSWGKNEAIEFLLHSGLDVNVASSNGWTPLMCALAPTSGKSTHCMCQTASFLLQHGASARVVTDEGWTPLHALASWPVAQNPEARLEVAGLARKLISGGAPTDIKSRVIQSPSTTASILPDVWGFRMRAFVENVGESVQDLGQAENTSPLTWARRCNAADVVDVLTAYLASGSEDGAS